MRGRKIKIFAILLLSLAAFTLLYLLLFEESKPRIIHLENYVTYPPDQKVKIDGCNCHVVTYFEDHWPETDQRLDLPPGYMDYVREYEDICWYIYYVGQNQREVEFLYNHHKLQHPIIIDTAGKFKELNPDFTKNVSFISALFYHDGRVKSTNSTMPGYKKALKDCLGED